MDRDRRRFSGDSNNNNGNFNGNDFNSNFNFMNDPVNNRGEFFNNQGFIPPQPTPIRRADYSNDQQYIDNMNYQPNIQQTPNQPAYPSQPAQFTMPFPQNQQNFGNNQEEFIYDYNQNCQRPSQMSGEMMKKKKGFFSFMNKKEEVEVPQTMNNVIIVYPKSVTEVSTVIDELRKGKAIIVDLNKVNEKFVQRTMDYLSGAIYALGGAQQRIANSMFLFTPCGVSIQGPTDLKKRFDN